jgi:hypothetical protein
MIGAMHGGENLPMIHPVFIGKAHQHEARLATSICMPTGQQCQNDSTEVRMSLLICEYRGEFYPVFRHLVELTARRRCCFDTFASPYSLKL